MAVEKVYIEQFLELSDLHPIIDARSPGEYLQAHIPRAYSLPLFTDDERRIVGTAYKQEAREKAIKLGLDFFGPKMRKMVEEVESLLNTKSNQRGDSNRTVLVHCWRGGMRSGAIAWLLDLYGFKVYTLAGGYKTFRNYILAQLGKNYSFNILGGYTGSGKTAVIKQLQSRGQVVIDLEKLASHKGSAFGGIGQAPQPSQEMFENLLALELLRTAKRCEEKNHLHDGPPFAVWMEDESQRIGTNNIPQSIWTQMKSSTLFFLDIPFEERLTNIHNEYGKLDKERLINAVVRIQKRLGGLETKTAINALVEGNVRESFSVLLKYYDKLYNKSLSNKEDPDNSTIRVNASTVDPDKNTEIILNAFKFSHVRN